MENQGFDYEMEAEKINNLFNEDLKSALLAKKDFREKTAFSLEEILEYLEYTISKTKQEKWVIRKILFYNSDTNKVDLQYYAIEETFDTLFRSFIRRNTEVEKETIKYIEIMKNNEMMVLLGTKTKTVKSREEVFDSIIKSDEEQRNYLEEDFFKFPQEYDYLYKIIIDHINRKNNDKHPYTKKVG